MLRFNEPSCRRLRLNISQYGDCSNKYITSAGIKVIYKRFSTSTSGCVVHSVYCVISWQQADITSSLADAISPQRGCVEWTHIQQPELTRKLAELQYAWTLDRPPDVWSTYSIVTVTRTDSSLEAFSYNPTDGSFVPLFGRTSTCTKCPRQRFLSYWAAFLS